jgi:hypothetical protein
MKMNRSSRPRPETPRKKAARRQHDRDPRQDLRPIEQYAHAAVQAQQPPRRLNAWAVLRAQLSARTLYSILFVPMTLAIAVYMQSQRPDASTVDLRYYIALAFGPMIFIGILVSELLTPLSRWWYALRYGRYRVARVIQVERRTVYYRPVLTGEWCFAIAGRTQNVPFRLDSYESGAWIGRLEAGSLVHVLLHPTKPKVLMAIGLVDEDSPILVSSATVPSAEAKAVVVSEST